MIDNYSLERRTALYENNRYMNNDRSSRERPNQAYQEVMASEMDFQKESTHSQSYNEEEFGNSTRSPIKHQQEIKTTHFSKQAKTGKAKCSAKAVAQDGVSSDESDQFRDPCAESIGPNSEQEH